jgi:uncharacterized protein (TIGR03435 family)
MATALGRVLNRLGADRGAEADAPMIEWNGPRRTRAFRPVFAAAAVVVAVGAAMFWTRGSVRVYAAGNDGLQVTLGDDASVEMRAHSEMTVARASDGIQIDLKTGDIIVTAARQREGHLSVRTTDITVAVKGTAFLASAGEQGSRVGVIEGEVRVRQTREGSKERLLQPGQQVVSKATTAPRPLADDITWSRNKDVYLRVIDSFTRAIAQTSGPLSPVAPAERQRDAGAVVPAALEFEEASVRECDPDNLPAAVPGSRGGGGANSIYMTPGRFYALCATPAVLIRQAYGYRSVNQEVEFGWYASPEAPGREEPIGAGAVFTAPPEDGQRVRGGPEWVRTEKYTIEAVAGGLDPKNDACASARGPCKTANTTSMSRPMLLALLERRFGLKSHVVTEPTTAYNLVIAPGGLKMKEGTCTPDPSLPPPQDNIARSRQIVDVARRNLAAARRGDATTGLCGTGVADNGPNRVIVGAGWTPGSPSQLARLFRGILGVPVTDRTGIGPGDEVRGRSLTPQPRSDTKRFNFALEFLLDERIKNPFYVIFAAGVDMQIATDPSRVQPAPDIFTALEQQLGLRLVPDQTSRDYIVIDAIRRPGPN